MRTAPRISTISRHTAWGAAKHYASKFGRGVLRKGRNGLLSLADRAAKFIARGCGCFEAGTTVWTARGLIPIEQVTTDDMVIARDMESGTLSLRQALRRAGITVIEHMNLE